MHLILAGLQQWFLRAGCLPAAPASAEGHAHAAVAGRRTSSQCTHKKLKYNRSPIEKIYVLYLSAHFCINCYVIPLCITVMPSLQYSNFKNSLSIPAVFMLVKVYSGGQGKFIMQVTQVWRMNIRKPGGILLRIYNQLRVSVG